jgi:hypothetical protein
MARVESSASLDNNLRDVCDNDFRFPPIQGNFSRHSHGFALVLLRIRELPRARRRYPSRECLIGMFAAMFRKILPLLGLTELRPLWPSRLRFRRRALPLRQRCKLPEPRRFRSDFQPFFETSRRKIRRTTINSKLFWGEQPPFMPIGYEGRLFFGHPTIPMLTPRPRPS